MARGSTLLASSGRGAWVTGSSTGIGRVVTLKVAGGAVTLFRFQITTPPEVRFRALLSSGAREVRLTQYLR